MGPYAKACHVLTGKCQNRVNFERLVSTKTFANATAPRRCLSEDRAFLLDKTKCERFEFFKSGIMVVRPRAISRFLESAPLPREEQPQTSGSLPPPTTRCIRRRNGEGKSLGKSVSERLTRGNLGRVPPSCHWRGACLKLTCGPRMTRGAGTEYPLGRGPTGRTPHC